MIISINAGKASDKVQYSFMIETLYKVDLNETYLNITRPYIKNPQLTSYPMVKN